MHWYHSGYTLYSRTIDLSEQQPASNQTACKILVETCALPRHHCRCSLIGSASKLCRLGLFSTLLLVSAQWSVNAEHLTIDFVPLWTAQGLPGPATNDAVQLFGQEQVSDKHLHISHIVMDFCTALNGVLGGIFARRAARRPIVCCLAKKKTGPSRTPSQEQRGVCLKGRHQGIPRF